VIDPDSSLEAFTASALVLATPRAGASAVATAKSLYVLGGDTATGATATIESAAIAADGTLGAFAPPTGVTLKVPHAYFATAVVGTSVFAIGGNGPAGADTKLTDIATIAADGTLGNFAAATSGAASVARHGAAVAIARDHVFVLGGNNGTSELGSVEHSGIATHGQLGAFSTLASEPLPAGRAYGANVVIGDHLYLVGGIDLSTLTSRLDVAVATVQADGSLGPFSLANGVTLNSARIGSSLAVIGDFLFVIGGQDPTNNSNSFMSLERAPIAADGTLGTFTNYASATLANGRYLAAPIILGSTLYVMGGLNAGAPISTFDQAMVDASGSISFFIRAPSTTFTVPHSDFSAAVLGSNVWVFGGFSTGPNGGTSSKVIERATFQSDGSLGAFAAATGTLSTERALYTPAIAGDDLYLVAGANNVGSPADPGLRNVDHATIAADGTVGAFAIPAGATLPEGIFFHFGAAFGNFVYVLGGGSHTSTTTPTEVKQALLP
jgi:hypothetical protein